jgi:hypothetical protein
MEKIKHIPIKLLFIVISLFFIDGGKSFSFVGSNMQIILNHHQKGDYEIPHQQIFNKYDDSEIMMNSSSFYLSCSSIILRLSPYYLNIRTEDYTGLVWQPPKSL